jgi:hypothetical protein
MSVRWQYSSLVTNTLLCDFSSQVSTATPTRSYARLSISDRKRIFSTAISCRGVAALLSIVSPSIILVWSVECAARSPRHGLTDNAFDPFTGTCVQLSSLSGGTLQRD